MSLVNPIKLKPVKSSSTTPVTVPANTQSTVFLAANPTRVGVIIYNNSISDLYVDLDDSVSTTSFAFKIAAEGGYYQVPYGYVGAISGIWEVADGNAMVREMLP